MSEITVSSYELSRKRRTRKTELTKAIGRANNQKQTIKFDCAQNIEELTWRTKDSAIAKAIGVELTKKYPGHGWSVHSNSQQGVVNIYNRHLSGKFGYILRLAEMEIGSKVFATQIMRIGGELLRRFSVASDTLKKDEILELQQDFAGRAKVDLS